MKSSQVVYIVVLWSCAPSPEAADPTPGALMRDPGGEGWAIHPPLMTLVSTIESNVVDMELGESLSVGDVNGDGSLDLVVGAPDYSNGSTAEGAVFLYLGSPTGLDPTPVSIVESNLASAFFGSDVSAEGDMNGDGFNDVLVVSTVAFDLYLGSAMGLETIPFWTIPFATAASWAGDVNGDGFDDIAVGDAGQDRAFVYLGSASGPDTVVDATLGEDQTEASNFGGSVSSAGDVNGDGLHDVMVGDRFFGDPFLSGGAVFLYLGSPAGMETKAAGSARGDIIEAHIGSTIAPAGDVNGDGFDDIVTANPDFRGSSSQGKAWVHYGSAIGLEKKAGWSKKAGQLRSDFGASLSSAGDVNGDGYDDVVIGAPSFGNEQSNQGQIFLFLGSASGLEEEASWGWHPSDQANASMGASVASGDFDGDGYSDVVGGAPRLEDDGQTDEGWVFLFAGRCHDDGIDVDADGIGDRCDDCVGDGCGLTVTVADPGLAGQDNTWTLSDAPAGVEAILVAGKVSRRGLAPGPKCAGVELGIQQVKLLGTTITDADGRSQLVLNVPASADDDAMNVQVLLPDTCTTSNTSSTRFQ